MPNSSIMSRDVATTVGCQSWIPWWSSKPFVPLPTLRRPYSRLGVGSSRLRPVKVGPD